MCKMASLTTALSWSSSVVDMGLPNIGGNFEETAKFSYGRSAMVVVAQKKATKSRKVILENGFSNSFLNSFFLWKLIGKLVAIVIGADNSEGGCGGPGKERATY